MGIELEWFSLLALHVLGTSIFGRFEAETAWWRLTLKWAIIMGLTYVVYRFYGHWAMLVIVIPAILGSAVHFTWCKKNGIHPLMATPRRKYYELRGWAWID